MIPITATLPPVSEQIEIGDFFVIAGAATGEDPLFLKMASSIPLAESAVSAAFAGFGGEQFFPDPVQRAAITCARIVKNHALEPMTILASWIGFQIGLP